MLPSLALADLEQFDPHAPPRAGERRFCCPSCGQDKPVDASHRSLTVSTGTGLWNCHRCHQGGKLREWWEDRPRLSGRARARASLRRTFAIAPLPSTPPADRSWRASLNGCERLAGTPGERYLRSRGVPLEIASLAGVRFHPDWLGRPAALFALRNREGRLVAAQGRYLDERAVPKVRTLGQQRAGAFLAFADAALGADPVIITEGPLDALSALACGHFALALVGTSWPDWLPIATCLRRVLIATDADEAGDAAALQLGTALGSLGAKVRRFRPAVGKDLNDWLRQDAAGLRAALAAVAESGPR